MPPKHPDREPDGSPRRKKVTRPTTIDPALQTRHNTAMIYGFHSLQTEVMFYFGVEKLRRRVAKATLEWMNS
jgi:hypothetical protein